MHANLMDDVLGKKQTKKIMTKGFDAYKTWQ